MVDTAPGSAPALLPSPASPPKLPASVPPPPSHTALTHLPLPPPPRRARPRGRVGRALAGYSSAEPAPPLAAYATLFSTFAAVFGGLLVHGARKRKLPPSMAPSDLALLGVSTYVVSRMIARDEVTAFVRAPFTHLKRKAGAGEVDEEARGHGMQLALGQLLTCPYCLSPWVAASLSTALVAAPKPTRTVMRVASAVAISQALVQAYSTLRKQS